MVLRFGYAFPLMVTMKALLLGFQDAAVVNFLHNFEFIILQFYRMFFCFLFDLCFSLMFSLAVHYCASPNDWLSTFSEPLFQFTTLHNRGSYVR